MATQHVSTRCRSSRWAVPCTALLLALSGCGGGGGGPEPPGDVEYAVASAVSAFVQAPHVYDLAGALDGVTFTVRYSFTPEGSATFEGRAATTAIERMALAANGQTDTTTLRSYFGVSPYRPYGAVDLGDGGYSVFTLTTDLPATARIGQSGTLGSEVDYADSTKAVVTGTATIGWSLEADTATTALFCVNVTTTTAPPMTGAQCYRVDPAGQVSGMVMRVNVFGKTLVLS